MIGLIAATNPVNQLVWWVAAMVEQVAANWGTVSQVLAVGLLVYALATLYRRARSDDDPSIRVQHTSGAGSASLLISGVAVTALLVGAIALLLWPLPVENLGLGMFLVGLVIGHYLLEREEVRG